MQEKEIKEEVFDITLFRVVFGGLKPNTSDQRRKELAQKTAEVLAIPPAKAEELLGRTKAVIKSDLDSDEANQLAQHLRDVGLEILVLGVDEGIPAKPAVPAPAAAPPPPQALPEDPVTLNCMACNVRNRVKSSVLLLQARCTVCSQPVVQPNKFPLVLECRSCKAKNRIKAPENLAQAKCARCAKRLLA